MSSPLTGLAPIFLYSIPFEGLMNTKIIVLLAFTAPVCQPLNQGMTRSWKSPLQKTVASVYMPGVRCGWRSHEVGECLAGHSLGNCRMGGRHRHNHSELLDQIKCTGSPSAIFRLSGGTIASKRIVGYSVRLCLQWNSRSSISRGRNALNRP